MNVYIYTHSNNYTLYSDLHLLLLITNSMLCKKNYSNVVLLTNPKFEEFLISKGLDKFEIWDSIDSSLISEKINKRFPEQPFFEVIDKLETPYLLFHDYVLMQKKLLFSGSDNVIFSHHQATTYPKFLPPHFFLDSNHFIDEKYKWGYRALDNSIFYSNSQEFNEMWSSQAMDFINSPSNKSNYKELFENNLLTYRLSSEILMNYNIKYRTIIEEMLILDKNNNVKWEKIFNSSNIKQYKNYYYNIKLDGDFSNNINMYNGKIGNMLSIISSKFSKKYDIEKIYKILDEIRLKYLQTKYDLKVNERCSHITF